MIGLVAPIELAALTFRDLLDVLWRNSKIRDSGVVEYLYAARGDGADRELRMSGGAELSDQERVERRLERSGNLESDGNATSRKSEHHDVVSLRVLRQESCEVLPSFPAIPVAGTGTCQTVRLRMLKRATTDPTVLGSRLAACLVMPSIPAVPVSRPVRIELTGASLNGDLTVPEDAQGLVMFVHGSGSTRFSPRNQAVADCLVRAQLGTLLLDLLTEPEERTDAVTAEFRFDIPLLADRTTNIVDWIGVSPPLRSLSLGLFGASTGAAAALIAAADRTQLVRAVVSRGGRPDLAGPALDRVLAPTLLIVGGRDDAVLDLNREAHDRLRGVRDLQIVPDATHLFEEPGALDKVGHLAAAWFLKYLRK